MTQKLDLFTAVAAIRRLTHALRTTGASAARAGREFRLLMSAYERLRRGAASPAEFRALRIARRVRRRRWRALQRRR